jgi:two-component system, NarL family, response regulator DevR
LGRIRVLLVDGHEGYRTGLARAIAEHPMLELAGEASDGREALEQVLLLQPDLLVLEVRLAKLGGIDVCRTLRGLDVPVGTRPVLLTGERNEAVMTAAADAGALAVLDKSAARHELLERLVQLGV